MTARLAGSAAALVALAFVVFTFAKNVAAVPPVQVTPALVAAIALSVAGHVFVVVLSAFAWRAMLAGAGAGLSLREAFVITGTSQIGKYVPGNVFHLAGRAALGARAGVAMPVLVASIALETLAIVVVGAAVAAPLALTHVDALARFASSTSAWIWAAVVLALAVLAAVAWRLAQRRVKETLAAALRIATPRVLALVALVDAAMFAIFGGCLFLVAEAAWPGAVPVSLWTCVGAFALAWVVGFATPGAPGGIGVREGVFLVVLSAAGATAAAAGVPAGDDAAVVASLSQEARDAAAMAAALAIVGRLQSIVADVLTFAVARGLSRGRDAQRFSANSR